MKDAKTIHDLAGQVRKDSKGQAYKILNFSHTVFVNYYCTWFIEYLDTGKRFYRPEIMVLKDKQVNK